jgi:Protein of unknown function (DUF2975)
MTKFSRISFILRFLFMLTFIAIPLLYLYNYLSYPEKFISLSTEKGLVNLALDPPLQSLHFFLYLIPVFIQMYIVFCLAKLFGCYQNNQVFIKEPLQYIRNIGIAVIAREITFPFLQGIMSYFASMHSGNLKADIIFSLTTQKYNNILMGIMMLIVAMIMYEAIKLKDKNDSTI